MIQSILRLSHKYDAPAWKAQMIAALSKYYPSTLSAFDVRSHWRVGQNLHKDVTILALNLVREVEYLQLMPAIIYDVATQFEPDEIENGVATLLLGETCRLAVIRDDDDRQRCLEAKRRHL